MITAEINKKEYIVELTNSKSGKVNNKPFEIDCIETNHSFNIIKDNKSYNITVVHKDLEKKIITLIINNEKVEVSVKSEIDILLKDLGIDITKAKVIKEIKAPMPGMVLNVLVKEGAEIQEGENLIILEAMKMENILKSPVSGKIKEIKAQKGKSVEKNEILIIFE